MAEPAAVRAGRHHGQLPPGPEKRAHRNQDEHRRDPHFASTQRKLEEKLDGTGRILVRPSGTEPVIRVMVEGQDEALINEMADELCELISLADRM
jgi:phosphomannomutase